MTGTNDEMAEVQAADWHARMHGEDMDWDAFALWLDADPAHQPAYDRIAMIDAEVTDWAADQGIAQAVTLPPAANDRGPVRRWWMAGAAAAALLAGIVSIPIVLTRSPAPAETVYATDATDTKDVALGDGSRVRLDRGTKLAVADGPEPRITLSSGAAYFDVRHDPARSFTVASGDFVIRDIGTRFAVTRRPDQLSVAVEQGAVEVTRQGSAPVLVTAGRSLDLSGTDPTAALRRVDPASVASWRGGRLIYDGTPLSLVAADFSRYAPRPVQVDPAVANLTFSGILLIGDGTHLVDQIKAVLPVEAHEDGDHVRLVERGRAGRR